jgi:HEAT repeat protein
LTVGPTLTLLLQEKDRLLAVTAARALGAIGPGATEAVGALAMLLDAEELGMDVASALALCQILGNTAEGVPFLVRGLGSRDHFRDAADGLGRLGPKAAAATPYLVRCLHSYDARLAATAAEALGRIGPPARESLPDLEVALVVGDRRLRAAAAEAIRKIGKEGGL